MIGTILKFVYEIITVILIHYCGSKMDSHES